MATRLLMSYGTNGKYWSSVAERLAKFGSSPSRRRQTSLLATLSMSEMGVNAETVARRSRQSQPSQRLVVGSYMAVRRLRDGTCS